MIMSDHPKLVSIHAALNFIASNRAVLADERVALEACLGRTLGEQKVLGLPGNPTAAYVMASLLLKGLVSGAKALAFTDAFLAAPLAANGARETFVRGRLELKNGHARACSLKDQDTSRGQALTSTNCLIHRPENDKEKSEGDLIQIVILDR